MSFQSPVFTNDGKALQMRTLGGEALIFTSIKIGDGQITSQPIASLTGLINTIASIPISKSTRTEKYFSVSGSFTNQAVSTGFYWREIGLFAADPDYPDDRTKDILYCYQNAYNLAEYIAAGGSEIIEKVIRLNVVVGNATTVTALIDSSTVFLTQEEFAEAITSYYTKEEADALLKGKSNTDHTHDDRYYTEEEISNILKGKSDTNHTHDDRYYTEAEADAQFAAKTDIPTSLPANGGNADTVGNIAATNIVRTLGVISDTNFLNNAAFYEYSYESSINATTASAIGLPAKFYIIKGFQFVNNGKYAVQIAYPRNHTGQAMIRYANGTDWVAWKGLGDGCNADMLDGKHAAEFFPKSDLSHSFALGTNPSANESRLMAFCDSTGSVSKSLGWLAHMQYADGKSAIGIVVKNNASASQTLFGITVQISEDGGTFYANTLRPSSPSLSALRNLASGTDEATASNCPNGCWYGQHE